MNDKQIINGIDVSECSYYNKDNEPYCCEVWDNECEAQNCYFKQFKRLQKENEKLKQQIKKQENAKIQLKNLDSRFAEDYCNIKEENKKLQKENEGLKSLNDFNVQKIEVLQEENEKLYKALEEIRNYASVLYGEPLIDGSKIRLKSGMYRIKTKINEVLNDRD